MTAASPPWPPPVAEQSTRLSSNAGVFRSPLTGKTQGWRKSGARFEFDAELHMVGPAIGPTTAGDTDLARIYANRAFFAKVQDRALNFLWSSYPQARPKAYPSGTGWGTPRVNGGSQTGRALVADGFTAGTTLKAGDPIIFDNDVRREYHWQTVDVTANGSGQVTLTLVPPIRRSPADNTLILLDGHHATAASRAAAEVVLADNRQAAYTMSGNEVTMHIKMIEALRT